jgi:hypothetical protein
MRKESDFVREENSKRTPNTEKSGEDLKRKEEKSHQVFRFGRLFDGMRTTSGKETKTREKRTFATDS